MALLIAPYNNAMRLGQGFNSYTQQICIDDAVIIDPERPENVITNDGGTMRILVESMGKASAWTRQPEVLVGGHSTDGEILTPHGNTPEASEHPEAANDSRLTATEKKIEEEKAIDAEENLTAEQKVTKKEEAAKNRKAIEADKLATWGAGTGGYTKADLAAMKGKPIVFEARPTGLGVNKGDHTFDPKSTGGPSQIVTYSSKFVDKLSDITDDMNISGSLSIKYGAIGGSGRGAFIDSDKFKESDLNFYISVKVINQTINFKDALQYNPLRSVNKDNFAEVYGDSFISGFLEGGEFNALVSMKILNKAKKTDIQAEAKIALTVGPAEIKAEAAVSIAKANIQNNTETTIQVSWSGGGHIKPMDQQWDIQALMQAASRFPDLVASTPQRTYAILNKYDTLRSFAALKPAAYTPLEYENATMYTNALMDTYMTYKSLYKKVSASMFDIDNETKEVKPWTADDLARRPATGEYAPFEASVHGLDESRRGIRHQMMSIVNEVDAITRDPKLATDKTRIDPFQSATAFSDRIPIVAPRQSQQPPAVPLSGQKIEASASPDSVQPDLYIKSANLGLSPEEDDQIGNIKKSRPNISQHLRLTAPSGSTSKGTSFNYLDFMQPEFVMSTISVEVADGAITALTVMFRNGLTVSRGKTRGKPVITLGDFRPEERIIAGSVETGQPVADPSEMRVTCLKLHTNQGRSLIGQATESRPQGAGRAVRDGVEFQNLSIAFFDTPLPNGCLKGFWGRSEDRAPAPSGCGIWRLGFIWGDLNPVPSSNSSSSNPEAINSVEARNGTFDSEGQWDHSKPGMNLQKFVRFETPFPNVPRIIHGISAIDMITPYAPRVISDIGRVSNEGFDATLMTWNDAHLYGAKMSWLTLPENDVNFQYGQVNTQDTGRQSIREKAAGAPPENVSFRIMFSKPYKSAPKVQCWFTGMDIHSDSTYRRLATWVTGIDPRGFTLNIGTWDNTVFSAARAGWLAWDSEADGKTVRSGTSAIGKGEVGNYDFAWYNGSFSKVPGTFIALNFIDVSPDKNFRGACEARGTKDRLTWKLQTWGDTTITSLRCVWIGME